MCRDRAACNLTCEKNWRRDFVIPARCRAHLDNADYSLYFNILREEIGRRRWRLADAFVQAAHLPAANQAALGRSSRQNRATIAVMTTRAAMTSATQPGHPA